VPGSSGCCYTAGVPCPNQAAGSAGCHTTVAQGLHERHCISCGCGQGGSDQEVCSPLDDEGREGYRHDMLGRFLTPCLLLRCTVAGSAFISTCMSSSLKSFNSHFLPCCRLLKTLATEQGHWMELLPACLSSTDSDCQRCHFRSP
jgi:hypothetical protein